MKNILCYGDSNTWGMNPETGGRYPQNVRWTGCLQKLLGPEYRIIEEGQVGRTTVWDDPIEQNKNGKSYLIPCLETHTPVDMVILMLGTNDLKVRFPVSGFDIARSVGTLVGMIQSHRCAGWERVPQIVVVRPAPILPEMDETSTYGMFDYKAKQGVITQTKKEYPRVAAENGCLYLDAEGIAEVSTVDCVHWTEKGHFKMAKELYQLISSAFVKEEGTAQ